MIPTINLQLTTVKIKGGEIKQLNVRNCFYYGVIGKIKTIYYWLKNNRDKSFKEYLNSPVKYVIGEPEIYMHPDCEKELEELLIQEIKNKI